MLKKFARLGILAGVAACSLLVPQRAEATSIVVNGGFETGDFTGWTQGGNTGFTGVTAGNSHSGNFAAFMGPVGSIGTLSQNLATTPGTAYSLSYWLFNTGGTPSSFSAFWNGSLVAGSSLTNAGPFGYTLFSFNVVGGAGATTALQFQFRQDPSFWWLDDVSVDSSAVPEPASMLLLGSGLVGLVALRRRARKS